MDYFHVTADRQELMDMSSLGLAYLGDSVFEIMVRTRMCKTGRAKSSDLHKAALKYVAAPRQAVFMERILPNLTEDEEAVYRRARNSSPHSVPKSATRKEYQMATGLEALFGWLWMQGQTDRLNELFEDMMKGEE